MGFTSGSDCALLFEQSGLGDGVFIRKVSDYGKFATLFLDAMDECKIKEDPYGFFLMGNVYRIFAELAEEFGNQNDREPSNSQLVERIIDYVDKNYGNDISPGKIAKNFFISPQYLARLFQREIRMTPSAYLTSVRLSKAAEMLSNGNFTVSSISESVGFSNPYYFSEVFKKKYLVPPARYRAMQRAENDVRPSDDET